MWKYGRIEYTQNNYIEDCQLKLNKLFKILLVSPEKNLTLVAPSYRIIKQTPVALKYYINSNL